MREDNPSLDLIRRLPWAGERIVARLEGRPTVAVLRLSGVIGQVGVTHRTGLTLAELASPIERAFRLPRLKAVALAVNSPGGTPVQAALIAERIRALSEEKEIPVYVFCEDVAASGGYWLACAADEIYAHGASIVGSIGVMTAGFGFPALMERLGIERRVHTAGEKKAMLDPFQPEKPEEVERLKAIQEDLHEQFKRYVRERRGERLKADDEELFSGEFWTGHRALELGLIDGIGELREVMRRKFGEKVDLRVVGGPRRIRLARVLGGGGRRNSVAELLAVIEERLFWGRFGL